MRYVDLIDRITFELFYFSAIHIEIVSIILSFENLQKLDLNGDGVVSMEEFLEACKADETIYQSVDAFTNSVI